MTSRNPIRRAATNPYDVAQGQHWVDTDPRVGINGQRYVEVLNVEGAYAIVRSYRVRTARNGKRVKVYGRTTRIRLDRFRPNQTGYRRVS